MNTPNHTTICLLGIATEDDIFSGPGKYAQRIAEHIDKSKTSTMICYPNHFNDRKSKFFLWKSSKTNPNIYFTGIFPFLQFILKSHPKIVHLLNYERIYFLIHFVKYFFPFKLIYTLHGNVFEEDSLKPELSGIHRFKNRLIERTIFRDAETIITFNQELAQRAITNYSGNCKVIFSRPGVDDIFFSRERKIISLNSRLNLTFLGGYKKREETTLKLIEELIELKDFLHISFIGFSSTGKCASSFECENIGKLPLEDWADLLHTTDIFISPYRNENYPISALEAMASECVVIYADTIKGAELIKSGHNGYTFNPDKPSEIRNIIQSLMDNPAVRYKIGSEAKKSVTSLRWNSCSKQLNEIYNDTLVNL